MPTIRGVIYVVAGNLQQARQYADAQGWPPHGTREQMRVWRYVGRPEDMQGFHLTADDEVCEVGTFQDRGDAMAISDAIFTAALGGPVTWYQADSRVVAREPELPDLTDRDAIERWLGEP